MTALTPGPRGSSAPASMNTARSRPRSPCFTCTAVDPVLSPTTPWCRPLALPRYPSAADASRSSRSGTGLRRSLADSPHQQAESRSSSYGPGSHLPWLRTPPHGDALMFGYRPESACLTRTCTSLTMHARRRTSAPLLRRPGMWRGGRENAAFNAHRADPRHGRTIETPTTPPRASATPGQTSAGGRSARRRCRRRRRCWSRPG